MSAPMDDKLRRALTSLDDLRPAIDSVAAARARAQEPRRVVPRWLWGLGLAAAGLAAGIVAATTMSLGRPPATSLAPVIASLVVLDVQGSAWQGEGEARVALRPGDRVASDTAVVTGEGARATFLDMGASVVSLSEATHARYRAARADVTRVDVVRGVVRIEARLAAVPLVVSVAGLEDTMRLEDGALGVVAGSGGGSFAVLDGAATLTRHGIVQTVTKGHEVTATYGDAGASTGELVLALAPVGAVGAGVQTLAVSGDTKPGVLVTVNGQDVVVDANGHFSTAVTVDGARRRIVITARDALDRSRRAVLALRRDGPKEPRERPTETHWEWERTPG